MTRAENSPELSAAIDAIRRGGVIVFPTETLYGLGADALNVKAVDKVFDLKGRDPNNPIPVIVADETMLFTVAAVIPEIARKLIRAFWPGPLTIILPARNDIPKRLVNSSGGVAVRISSGPIATRLCRAVGRPLTATSANTSGQAPARTIQEARRYFAKNLRIFVDGGRLNSGTGSTVVQVFDDNIGIVREGEISARELEPVLKLSNGKLFTVQR